MAKDIFNWYTFLEANPLFKQVEVDELLFAAYDCPLEGSPINYWVQKNYFCYIIKGGARWRTPKADFTFRVGDAAFLTRGAHRVFKIDDGEFCALIIFMPDEFIASALKNELDTLEKWPKMDESEAVIPLRLDQTLIDYFGSLLNYFSQTTPPSKSLLKLKFKELILNIIGSNKNPLVTEYFRMVVANKKKDMRSIMEEHFFFNLKMEEFADMTGRSLASFRRDFKKHFGIPPGKWLKKKRLEYAKFLLKTTELNVNEIALDSGFENTSHFIKAFKEIYDLTPLKYKKAMLVE